MAAFLTFKHLLLKLTESFGQCTMDWLNVLLFKCDSMTLKWQCCPCRWVVWKKKEVKPLQNTLLPLSQDIPKKHREDADEEHMFLKIENYIKSSTIFITQPVLIHIYPWFLSLQSLRIQCAEGKHVFIIYERPFINYLLYAREITINVRH